MTMGSRVVEIDLLMTGPVATTEFSLTRLDTVEDMVGANDIVSLFSKENMFKYILITNIVVILTALFFLLDSFKLRVFIRTVDL